VAEVLAVTVLVNPVVAEAEAETEEDPVPEILLQQLLPKVSLEVLEVQDKQDHLVTQELAAAEPEQLDNFKDQVETV
jgi:hypothetical protein